MIEIAGQLISIIIYPGLLFLLVFSMLYSGLLRKLSAKMQGRVGPPVWQPFLDALKLFGKEEVTPEQAKPGFTMWPFVALASMLIAGFLTPIAGVVSLGPSNLLIIVYFIVLAALSLIMAGFSSSNPFAVVGSIRGLVQMFSYEITFIISLLVPVLFLNTFDPLFINNYQLTGGWLALSFPFAALAFIIAVLAKAELPPFHVPEAHQEIVSGYYTEYSGFKLLLIELTHMLALFVLLALGVALFFGGAGNILIFLVKTLALLFALTGLRVLLARLRIDHVLKFGFAFGLIAIIDILRVLLI